MAHRFSRASTRDNAFDALVPFRRCPVLLTRAPAASPCLRWAHFDRPGFALLVDRSWLAPAAKNVAPKLPRCRLGLHAQLSPQNLLADPELPQSLRRVSGLVVEPHEGAVDGFLKRVDGQQAQCGLHGVLMPPGPLLVLKKLGEGSNRQRGESSAFTNQPFLKGTSRQAKPF